MTEAKFTKGLELLTSGFVSRAPIEIWRMTQDLRFINKDGKKILQQGFINSKGHIRWEDVPEVEAEGK